LPFPEIFIINKCPHHNKFDISFQKMTLSKLDCMSVLRPYFKSKLEMNSKKVEIE